MWTRSIRVSGLGASVYGDQKHPCMGTRSNRLSGLGASVYRDQEHPCIGTRSIRVSGLEAPVYLMLLQCHEYGLSATFSLLSNSIDHQPFGPFRLLYEVPGYIWSEDYEVFLIFPGMRLHTERESCKRIIALPRDIYVHSNLYTYVQYFCAKVRAARSFRPHVD